jgi:prepilin-type N-terminal cleavage/methylation domain-containing protein
MNEKSNKAITAPLGNNKGFTLIEMAIVLVIIGIIISAVVKGGDLIESANQKKLVSEVNSIRAAYFSYFDRNGKDPGGTDGFSSLKFTPQNTITYTLAGSGLTATGYVGSQAAYVYQILGDGDSTNGKVRYNPSSPSTVNITLR